MKNKKQKKIYNKKRKIDDKLVFGSFKLNFYFFWVHEISNNNNKRVYSFK